MASLLNTFYVINISHRIGFLQEVDWIAMEHLPMVKHIEKADPITPKI